MAVGNSLAPKAQQKPEKVEFEVAGEKVVLTPQTVREPHHYEIVRFRA